MKPEYPKCPTCGDEATYQAPDGVWWDGNAHYWKADHPAAPPELGAKCGNCGLSIMNHEAAPPYGNRVPGCPGYRPASSDPDADLPDDEYLKAKQARFAANPEWAAESEGKEHDMSFVGGSAEKQHAFGMELTALINTYSLENDSDTPDIVLSTYILACLKAFNCSVRSRQSLTEIRK